MREFVKIRLASIVMALSSSVSLADSADYESLLGCEKESVIWQEIKNTEYDSLPQWKGTEPLELFSFLLPWVKEKGRKFLGVTLNRISDEMPEGRLKHIHTYGSAAPVAFVSNNAHPFTGLFEGVKCGLVRVSLAAKPDNAGITPGLAIKWFIDGKPSRNFMAMYSLDGQPSYNFFASDFSNWVAPPEAVTLKLLSIAFGLVAKDPKRVDVSYLAEIKEDGVPVEESNIVRPVQIYLIPNRETLQFASEPHEIREDMARIAAGTVLYTVLARGLGASKTIEVGKIVLKDRFIAASYADEKLFFRHEKLRQTIPD